MENQSANRSPLIPLPASNAEVLAQVIEPALHELPVGMTSDPARAMLLAIGRQESGFKHRTQLGGGPARGMWQFEVGGVTGVMRHARSAQHARDWCELHGVAFAPSTIYKALANDDVFAAGIARLLLWTDAAALPNVGDEQYAWMYYLRNWRPGKPSRDRWTRAYDAAMGAVRGAS